MPQISGKIVTNAIILVLNLHEHYLVGEMDLGQAVQDCTLIVHIISCLNCTVQLTDTSIVNNLKRNFENTEIVKVHDMATSSYHLALHEVCRKTTELS